VLAARPRGNFAGCFGWLVLDDELCQTLRANFREPHQTLWIDPTPDEHVLREHAALMEQIAESDARLGLALADYRSAVRLALSNEVALHWRMFPRGESDGLVWRIAEHCPRCRGPMSSCERRCAQCGFVGRCHPARTRKARGSRPYVRLERFLGDAGARAFTERFRQQSKSRE
jgi:hypothetical protein